MRLRRYLAAGFGRFFLISGTGFLAFFFLAEILSDLPDAIRTHSAFSIIPYLTHLPMMWVEISPVVTFLAALLLVAEMIRGNELRVLEVSGIPPVRAVGTTLLAAGLASSLAAFWCLEGAAVPIEAGRIPAGVEGPIHFSSRSLLISAQRFAGSDTLQDVLISTVQDGNRREVRARQAVCGENRWLLSGAVVWSFGPGGIVEERVAGEMHLDMPLTADDLRDAMRPPGGLSVRRLSHLLKNLAAVQVRPVYLVVALHERFAYPLLNLFILVAGIPLLFPRRKTGRILVLGLSVLVSFFSYVIYSFGVAFARGGKTPPWAGVWLFHLSATIFLSASMLRARRFSRIMAARPRVPHAR